MQEPEALREAPTQVLLLEQGPLPQIPSPVSSDPSLHLRRCLSPPPPPNTRHHCTDEGPLLGMEHQKLGFPGRHRCRDEQVQPWGPRNQARPLHRWPEVLLASCPAGPGP